MFALESERERVMPWLGWMGILPAKEEREKVLQSSKQKIILIFEDVHNLLGMNMNNLHLCLLEKISEGIHHKRRRKKARCYVLSFYQ